MWPMKSQTNESPCYNLIFRLKKPVKELLKVKMVNQRRLEADQRDLASSVSVRQRKQPRPLQK